MGEHFRGICKRRENERQLQWEKNKDIFTYMICGLFYYVVLLLVIYLYIYIFTFIVFIYIYIYLYSVSNDFLTHIFFTISICALKDRPKI